MSITPAPETGVGAETLDLVRIGADGSLHWLRVWPTLEENRRHAGLGLWMAVHGYQIVSKPATWFDWCPPAAAQRQNTPHEHTSGLSPKRGDDRLARLRASVLCPA